MNVGDPCPGAGKCHGCLCWCDACGDCDLSCESPTCQRHHCQSCQQLLGPDDRDDYTSVCWSCALAALNDDMLIAFEWNLERGNLDRCDQIAADIHLNREPWRDAATELVWALYRPIGSLLWLGVR